MYAEHKSRFAYGQSTKVGERRDEEEQGRCWYFRPRVRQGGVQEVQVDYGTVDAWDHICEPCGIQV